MSATPSPQPLTSLEVFALAGGRRVVAHALGISVPATYRWGEHVPPARANALAALLGIPVDRLLK